MGWGPADLFPGRTRREKNESFWRVDSIGGLITVLCGRPGRVEPRYITREHMVGVYGREREYSCVTKASAIMDNCAHREGRMFGLTVYCRSDGISPRLAPLLAGEEGEYTHVKWRLANFMDRREGMVDEIIEAVTQDISRLERRLPALFNYPLGIEVSGEELSGHDVDFTPMEYLWSSEGKNGAEFIPESRRTKQLDLVNRHRSDRCDVYKVPILSQPGGSEAVIYVVYHTSRPVKEVFTHFFSHLTIEEDCLDFHTPYKSLLYISKTPFPWP